MYKEKPRGFSVILAYLDKNITVPLRSTPESAGYDIEAAAETIVPAGGSAVCETGLKAYMQKGEVLKIYARSSLYKRGLMLANGVGVIDSDYYDNPENEGHIRIILYNYTRFDVTVSKGERIAQGIFEKYLSSPDEQIRFLSRKGGIGSTGR